MQEEDRATALAQTVLRQGELRLQAQLQVAIGADQRAMTMGAVFIAGAAACLGFASDADLPGLIGALVAAAQLLSGAGLAIGAAWPTAFRLVGSRPNLWWTDGVEDKPLAAALEKESNNYAKYIAKNDDALDAAAQWLMWGAVVGASAPVVGAAAWAAVALAV